MTLLLSHHSIRAWKDGQNINKFVTLSCPISLAFSFKCYFVLLILIDNLI